MGRHFDSEKLERRLAPQRYVLNLPEVMKNGISFVRASSIDRMYEHLLIRPGKAAYAETVISAASFTSCHACVSEVDGRFRALLSGDSDYQISLIETSAEANAWQKRLVENADAYCRQMAAERGPLLAQRLQPVFDAVDSYVHALGDMFAILDREFAYLTETPSAEKAESIRLANLACSMLYLNSEDAKLASLALVRFGSDVEGQALPFHGKLPRQHDSLAARLILLADYVRTKRLEYDVAGGLCR